jgi:hypothetical protein
VSGRSVFTGDRNGPILQWDSNNGTCQKLLDRPLQSCALTSVDNREVWVGLADGDILAIDIAGRVARGRWHAHTGGVFCLVAGARCVWSGGADFQIRKWDLVRAATSDPLWRNRNSDSTALLVSSESLPLKLTLVDTKPPPLLIQRCSGTLLTIRMKFVYVGTANMQSLLVE